MADIGRPSKYTQELADRICERLAMGESMRSVCRDESMPAMSSVFKWLREDQSFSQQYARAKQESADAMAEDILTIAEATFGMVQENPNIAGPMVQAQRLHIDTKKWLMSKMQPKKYGEKLDLTTDGKELPQPIMKLEIPNGILRNNSNKEDIEPDEED